MTIVPLVMLVADLLYAVPVRQTQPPPEERRGIPAPTSRPFQESRFHVLFPNLEGTAQVILPSWTFRDLERIFFQENPQTSAPTFSILKVEAKGNVVDNIAQIRFEFLLTTQGNTLVNVPIGLKEGISLLLDSEQAKKSGESSQQTAVDKKTQSFQYTGDGKCELTVDSVSGDYVLWLQNPQPPNPRLQDLQSSDEASPVLNQNTIATHTHQIAFSLAFPINHHGDEEQRLKISFPPALSSRLVLAVPLSDAVPTDTQGTAIVRSVKPIPPHGTEFEIQGISKTLNLSWRRQIQTPVQEKPAVLHVEDAKILVQMNYKETEFNATLPVRSVGGPLQSFTIHLPPGAKYVPDPQLLQVTKEYQIQEKIRIPENAPVNAASSETSSAKIVQNSNEPPTSALEVTSLDVVVSDSTKSDGIIPVRIKAVRFATQEDPSGWGELGGFEVEGAEQQSGHLEIRVLEDMKLNLKNLHGIREDDSLLAPSGSEAASRETLARFVYYTQPFSMQARVVFPKTQVLVKPEYQILLDRRQILLTGRVSTIVSGSKTYQLQWNFYDWQLDDVGPNSIVDYAGVVRESEKELQKKGTTTIPLRVPTDGTIDLTFSASRTMPPILDNRTVIEFPVPLPIADRVESAAIVIVPADNLELPFASQKIVGMSRGNRNDLFSLPPRQQEPFVFRTDIPTDPANYSITFRSDVIVHNQEVFASSKTVVRVLEPKDQVEQRISFNVKFEPLDQITLLVPKSINDSGSLRLYFDDKPLSDVGRTTSQESSDGKESGFIQRHITLPNPLLGTGVLSLRYSCNFPKIEREATNLFTVPLIVPLNTKFVEQTVVCTAPNGVNVTLPEEHEEEDRRPESGERKVDKSAEPVETSIFGGSKPSTDSPLVNAAEVPLPSSVPRLRHNWAKIEKTNNAFFNDSDLDSVETMFESRQWESEVAVLIHLDYVDILGTTVVERGLIQTWLTDQMRFDHAMFRIKSDHERIPIYLPSVLDRTQLAILLDEKQVPVLFDNGAFVIIQSPEQRSKVHLLDVKYQYPLTDESLLGNQSFELPFFEKGVWVQRVYWQIIMPQNRHILGGCFGWTPEFRWNWSQLFSSRLGNAADSEPLQEELRLWIGASSERQNFKVPLETSRYLFSSFNPPQSCTLSIVDRSQLILLSSGTVLLFGWIFIYFPRIRVPGVLFTLLVLFGSVLLYKPATTLLLLQASVLGVVLTLISAILAKIVFRNSQWRSSSLAYIPTSPSIDDDASSFSAPSEPLEVIFDSTGHKTLGKTSLVKTSFGKTEQQ